MCMLKNRYFSKILLFLLLFALAGCGIEITIEDLTPAGWDAPLTKILSKSSVFADGQTKSVLKLQVFNTDGNILPGLNLKAQNVPFGMTFDGCLPSDENGIAYCFFRSTAPGISTFEISDGFSKLATDLTFIKPAEKLDVKRLASTKLLKQNELGYVITSGLKRMNGFKQTESGFNINTETQLYKLNFTSP